ncbi:Uncharacterised protein [Mycobacteroides abscessus subsp. abscessus]|nr:Uncharacterised protein [Mycobacteroides abscessus subsp. abscessus]
MPFGCFIEKVDSICTDEKVVSVKFSAPVYMRGAPGESVVVRSSEMKT